MTGADTSHAIPQGWNGSFTIIWLILNTRIYLYIFNINGMVKN